MHPWNIGRLAIAVREFARTLRSCGLGCGWSGFRRFWNGTRIRRGVAAAKGMVVAVVCAGLWVSGAVGAEDSGRPRGPGIDDGVREWNDQGRPVSGALRLLAQVNTELRTSGRTDLLALRATLFEAACYRASGEELRALGAMIPDLALRADESPHDCDRFKKCITFYGNAAFRHEVSKLIARPAQLKLPASSAAPPAELTIAPKTLRDAWFARAAVMEPFERLKETVTNESTATSKPAEFKETPEARPDIAVLKKLGPTPPRGLCRELMLQAQREELEPIKGDGAISRRALHYGIVVSLLAEGKMDMAVGAVCSRIFAEEGYPDDPKRQTYAAVTRDFLSAQGLDWELIFMGLMLRERPVKPGEFGAALANTEPWLMLGAFGSPREVQTGLDWIGFAKMGTEESRPFLLRVLGPDPVPRAVLVDYLPKRVKALPREIRAQAIAALAGYLDPAQPLTPLNRTLEDVSVWLAKDLEEPLKKLLTHRSRVIASRALWLLKSAGLVPEETTLAPGPGPIRVRVLLNGVPLANTKVLVQGRGFTQRITTGADGELSISLDGILQPETIGTIQLSVTPNNLVAPNPRLPKAIAEPLPPVPEQAKEEKPANAAEVVVTPWFHVSVPVNLGEQSVREVVLESGELEVGLKGCPGIPNDTPLHILLVRDENISRTSIRVPGKPWQSVVIQGVQVGKYRISIEGATLAQAPWLDVHVTKRGSLKLLELTPGRTVRGALAGGAPNLRLTSIAKLTRDGVRMRAQLSARGDQWTGLPLGKYRLRIPSTKELEAAPFIRGIARPAPQLRRHAGFETEFELTAESPAVVDLGVIQLKPEEGGK